MTKIEVLIVLLVLGVMGALSAVAVSTARERTRDATRLSHVRELQNALESYFSDHSAYPAADEATALGQGATQCLSDDGFDCSIAPDGAYLEIVPTPPTKGLKGAVSCGDTSDVYCYESDGDQYRIQFELEGKNNVLGLVKGANCATESNLVPGACGTLE
ncbi:hypothetical protein HYS28_01795 [Candidatus Uhrbacteria bacterium]|nr:hypothetical protein [Candidatus Uhrbacteria bacterium]